MARVRVDVKDRNALARIAKSAALGDQLEAVASPILDAARRDPNDEYVATLRMKRFTTSGRKGRISVQVGAAPIIGSRVEAKRGTLARALGSAGV